MRKLVPLDSQGGDIPALDIVAGELRVRFGMLAVVVSCSRFGHPEGLSGAGEAVHGIHAGEAETSLMLAFRPGMVRHDALPNLVPTSVAIAGEFAFLDVTQPIGCGRMAPDVSFGPRRPSRRSAPATQFRIAWADGSNSRARSCASRPERTRSTICCRNSGA